MEREILAKLLAWKDSAERKPLMLLGARQVGKTWLLKEFGKRYYRQTIYLSLDKDTAMATIFEKDFNVELIVQDLEIFSQKTFSAKDTLIILDEVQIAPRAITALKYFCEDAPEIHIAVAGSFLGIELAAGTGFPVGKVETLELNPLTFGEFLDALGENALRRAIANEQWDSLAVFEDKLIRLLQTYYFVGGMPEVVENYCKNKHFSKARAVQNRLLENYKRDFSKHVPAEILANLRLIWNSVPAQLARENKKFIFSAVKHKATSKTLAAPIQWLADAGLVDPVNNVKKPAIPLAAYAENAFKLYFLDVGLLAAMCGLDERILLEKNQIFGEFKGALTEQFVRQHLKIAFPSAHFYWSSDALAEVDFLVQHRGEIFPLEVKAELNLQAKSLKIYAQRYSPKKMLRLSMKSFSENSFPLPRGNAQLIDLPLYAVENLQKILEK